MIHNPYFTLNPLTHIILDARDFVAPSPNNSRHMMKGHITINLNQSINTRFLYPQLLLLVQEGIKIFLQNFLQLKHRMRRVSSYGILDAVKPSHEPFLFPKNIPKMILVPNLGFSRKIFNRFPERASPAPSLHDNSRKRDI